LRGTLADRSDVTHIIFDMSGVNDIDAVALSAMERMVDGYAERDIAVAFAGMKGPVRDVAERAGWPSKYGTMVGYLSLQQAVSELQTEEVHQ
jgi:SulP family sulfate permease